MCRYCEGEDGGSVCDDCRDLLARIQEDTARARTMLYEVAAEKVGDDSKCSTCSRPLIWIRTPKGTAIPLDKSAPVYRGEDGERARGYYVTHFATCPFAAKHSKGGAD